MKIDLYIIVSNQTKVRAPKLDDLQNRLNKNHDVRVTFITGNEPEDITPHKIRETVVIEKINSQIYDALLRTLGPKHVSNALKHLDALKAVATDTRSGSYPIVLEDDPLTPDTFDADFQTMFDNLPFGWDMIMLGLPGKTTGFQHLHDVYKALPVCNAYMIKQSAASRIANTFLPLRYVTNIHLSYCLDAFGIKPLLYAPQLLIDGSKYGVYVSTLSPTNDLIFNKEFVLAKQQIYEGLHQDALLTIRSSPLRNHPDFMHLQALCELQVHGKEVAENTFEKALTVFEENNAITNNESKFLSDYIELYRPAGTPR
eukprot:jgi/Tetstr1/447267/TSEL_034704.t1